MTDPAITKPAPCLLIGLSGPAGSGKSTAAELLQEHYGFAVIALADPIVDMLSVLADHVDLSDVWIRERQLKEQPMPVLGKSYRELAQTLGTGWGRETIAQDLWLRIAEHKLRQARLRGDNVCISDVRFPNEAQWLRAQGGVLVALERRAAPVRAHTSEAHFASLAPEHTLRNGHTFAHLFDQIDTLISRLRASAA